MPLSSQASARDKPSSAAMIPVRAIRVTKSDGTVRASIAEIDVIYTAIAEEARKYTIEAPSLALSSGMRRSTAAAPAVPTLSSLEKLALVHSLSYSVT